MEPVKVTFVSSHAQLGGSEVVLDDLLSGLGPDWVASLVSLQEGPFVSHLERHGPVDVIHTSGNPLSVLRGAKRLRGRIRSVAPALVHANGVKAAVAAVLATRAGGPPVIWFKQDTTFDGAIGRAVARRCALVVGVSRSVLAGLGEQPNFEVVHPGIEQRTMDRSAARAKLTELHGIASGAQVVALVGRLHPTKGHSELIQAASTVLATRPDVRFLFVGGSDPSQPTYLESLKTQLAAAGLSDRFTFLGHVDDPLEIMAAADLAVIPSVVDGRSSGPEGFGLVAVEAMSVGTPVIAYAHGALPEVLGQAGVTTPPGDRVALGQAISDLLSDPARWAELASAGRRRAGDFPAERPVELFKELYSRVALA